MQWCVGNVKQEPRGSSGVAITKQSASAKIDPVAAMFSAAMLMSLNPEAKGGGMKDYLAALRTRA
jgi:phage terminase large subunit-like protein